MLIDELDEYQGLRITMVDEWLSRNGWQPTEGDRIFERGPTVLRVFSHDDLVRVAAEHRLSPQALLREINPRMRKGTPSLAAWEAHGGEEAWWLAVDHDNHTEGSSWEKYRERPIVTQLRQWVRSDNAIWWTYGMPGIGWMGPVARPDWKASFWPCDEHGNKVRWPTDADGKML